MKRIAIFCDGTWSKIAYGQCTHISKLSQAVKPTASDGVPQVVFYQQGIGTGRGKSKISQALDRWLGGVFGIGLDSNVIDAYRHLVYWYEPGDEVFVFGFSRGAYTARSLVGLIRRVGISSSARMEQLESALFEYRCRKHMAGSDDLHYMQARHILSPLTATSQQDLDWRRKNGDTQSFLLQLTYLGVFDTVGAFGVPGLLGPLSSLFKYRYQFHDTHLSSMVRSARHAVAIDERRKVFPPTLWSNLDELNNQITGEDRPYQQKWFPGNHGVVGGSGESPELAWFSLQWIVQGAAKYNLELDLEKLKDLAVSSQLNVTVNGFDPDGQIYQWLDSCLLEDRIGPCDLSELSDAAIRYYQANPTYRPGALQHLEQAILEMKST